MKENKEFFEIFLGYSVWHRIFMDNFLGISFFDTELLFDNEILNLPWYYIRLCSFVIGPCGVADQQCPHKKECPVAKLLI